MNATKEIESALDDLAAAIVSAALRQGVTPITLARHLGLEDQVIERL